MIRYEIQEKAKVFGGKWNVVAWFDNEERALGYWNAMPKGCGAECRMLKHKIDEDCVHYHSADGETYW